MPKTVATEPHLPENYKFDFQTPTFVGNFMVSLIPPGTKTILEPTPGVGKIVKLLKGYEVTAPPDYFLLKKKRYDCIIMNPPFSTKFAILDNAPDHVKHAGMRMGYYFLTESCKMSDHVIALMPWFTLSDSDVRLRSLKRYGIKSITALPRKTFKYARIQTVVLELHKGYKHETIFRVLDLHNNKQKSFPWL